MEVKPCEKVKNRKKGSKSNLPKQDTMDNNGDVFKPLLNIWKEEKCLTAYKKAMIILSMLIESDNDSKNNDCAAACIVNQTLWYSTNKEAKAKFLYNKIQYEVHFENHYPVVKVKAQTYNHKGKTAFKNEKTFHYSQKEVFKAPVYDKDPLFSCLTNSQGSVYDTASYSGENVFLTDFYEHTEFPGSQATVYNCSGESSIMVQYPKVRGEESQLEVQIPRCLVVLTENFFAETPTVVTLKSTRAIAHKDGILYRLRKGSMETIKSASKFNAESLPATVQTLLYLLSLFKEKESNFEMICRLRFQLFLRFARYRLLREGKPQEEVIEIIKELKEKGSVIPTFDMMRHWVSRFPCVCDKFDGFKKSILFLENHVEFDKTSPLSILVSKVNFGRIDCFVNNTKWIESASADENTGAAEHAEISIVKKLLKEKIDLEKITFIGVSRPCCMNCAIYISCKGLRDKFHSCSGKAFRCRSAFSGEEVEKYFPAETDLQTIIRKSDHEIQNILTKVWGEQVSLTFYNYSNLCEESYSDSFDNLKSLTRMPKIFVWRPAKFIMKQKFPIEASLRIKASNFVKFDGTGNLIDLLNAKFPNKKVNSRKYKDLLEPEDFFPKDYITKVAKEFDIYVMAINQKCIFSSFPYGDQRIWIWVESGVTVPKFYELCLQEEKELYKIIAMALIPQFLQYHGVNEG